jgi:fructose-1,6-bisphosphatase/inositol monophosphatase family enzyme
MTAGSFRVEPGQVTRHVELIKSLATEIEQAAGPLAALAPTVATPWIGSEGGAATLRKALTETVEAVRRTGAEARRYADLAGGCATGYAKRDQSAADEFRACLLPAGR